MTIGLFNTLLDGGAATAARRLHDALREQGVDTQFFYKPTKRTRSDVDASYQAVAWGKRSFPLAIVDKHRHRPERKQFQRWMELRPMGSELFSSATNESHSFWPPRPVTKKHARGTKAAPIELIHLHWIAHWMNYETWFASLPPAMPIVWTLHDMNAMTGGCHFSDRCDGYLRDCSNCHQLPGAAKSIGQEIFRIKDQAFNRHPIHVAAPSRWLLDAARNSRILGHAASFHHIPYGIDTNLYYPEDRQSARQKLGIAADAKVFCFGAMAVDNHRKGARELIQAISLMADDPQVEGIVFGYGDLPPSDLRLPRLKHLGKITGAEQQRLVYSAADVFILPSLEDNLPLTGLEAMSCGTPVLGFRTGGMPDYVVEGKTGRLVPTGDAVAMGHALQQMLGAPDELTRISVEARRMMVHHYQPRQEANAYQTLYAELMSGAERLRRAA
jgi:glycosyltransferase involved in cell wall biosynthesis